METRHELLTFFWLQLPLLWTSRIQGLVLKYLAKEGVMYGPVSRILTSFSWQEIAGFHPREVREFLVVAFDCLVGVFVNERTQRKKPFRFYAHRGANINSLAYAVWPMIKADANLIDVLLTA